MDPGTFQASTAGELTFGKDKARDMLKLKKAGQDNQASTGLAHPQDVSGTVAVGITACRGQIFVLDTQKLLISQSVRL